jgi:hypothetical protein
MNVSDTLIKSLNQRLSEEAPKKTAGKPRIATYDELKAIGAKKMSPNLIEKLNQRLGEDDEEAEWQKRYGRQKPPQKDTAKDDEKEAAWQKQHGADMSEPDVIKRSRNPHLIKQQAAKQKAAHPHESVIEKLNQRLGEQELKDKFKDTDDPKEGGADDVDFLKNEVEYKIDFAPLISSLKKEFGSDAFIKPEKDNGEVLCVYFDPDVYEVQIAKFQSENLQDWCTDKGFVIVSRMPSVHYIKVYFTAMQLLNDESDGEGGVQGGEKFSNKNSGLDFASEYSDKDPNSKSFNK